MEKEKSMEHREPDQAGESPSQLSAAPPSTPSAAAQLESHWQKLSRKYSQEGKLTQYPSRQPMRILALLKIAEKFEPAAKYREKEVNEIIKSAICFSDVELVRRELYQYRMLGRLADGSAYWLETDIEERYGAYLEVLKKGTDLPDAKDSTREIANKQIADR